MMSDLMQAQLYDGTGLHIGGVYSPICERNVLTDAYAWEKTPRPAQRKITAPDAVSGVARPLFCAPPPDEDGPLVEELGLVWMVPLGLTPADPVLGDVIAALVQTLDAGQSVILHSLGIATDPKARLAAS